MLPSLVLSTSVLLLLLSSLCYCHLQYCRLEYSCHLYCPTSHLIINPLYKPPEVAQPLAFDHYSRRAKTRICFNTRQIPRKPCKRHPQPRPQVRPSLQFTLQPSTQPPLHPAPATMSNPAPPDSATDNTTQSPSPHERKPRGRPIGLQAPRRSESEYSDNGHTTRERKRVASRDAEMLAREKARNADAAAVSRCKAELRGTLVWKGATEDEQQAMETRAAQEEMKRRKKARMSADAKKANILRTKYLHQRKRGGKTDVGDGDDSMPVVTAPVIKTRVEKDAGESQGVYV